MALGKYSPLEKEILVSVLTFIHSEALLKAGCYPRAGVSHLLVSLGHTGRRRAVSGHILNTLRHIITQTKIS